MLNYHINANATANGGITQSPAECINTIGSFKCGCDDTGLTIDIYDEKNCFAVDDCSSAPCGDNAYCKNLDNIVADGSNRGYVNLENTFECGCNAAWEPTNCAFAESDASMAFSVEILAEGCKNVNGCAVGLANGQSIAEICANVLTGENQDGALACVDSDGSFTGTCQNGYKKQGSIAEGDFACVDFIGCSNTRMLM